MTKKAISTWEPGIVRGAVRGSFRKLDPRVQWKNPVMFVTEVVSALTLLVLVRDLATGSGHLVFTGLISGWLWFTVLFANFAEAMAEGRGKAQADALRKTRTDTEANLVRPGPTGDTIVKVSATQLR